ncbi:MAG: hypothetical protein Q9M97_07425 [Candidatus Gracilibacteria bacterium]|nr:hypothetical protein [Candidatus Gracilibacteria bacterium]
MKKYKEKADQRLNIAQINKNDFYNSKGEKIELLGNYSRIFYGKMI